ncbi:MAG: hypothetical protein RLN99_19550 [Kiloniellaceae bacterium]
MKLNVFGTVAEAYAFGLRHFPAFYLLVVLTSVPQYVRGQLSFPEWQERLVYGGGEMLLSCLVVALMAAVLKRDSRGETWSVLPAVRDVATRATVVLGVSILTSLHIIGLLYLGDALYRLHPVALIAGQIVHFFVMIFFCMALACAAVGRGGVVDCFRQGVALSAGSPLRIAAAALLTMVQAAAAWALLVFYGSDPQIQELWDILSFFGLPLFSIFPFALPVVAHARLAGSADDSTFGEAAAVFD